MTSTLFSLSDRIAYVTGGLGTIGAAICHALGSCGASAIALDVDLPEPQPENSMYFDITELNNLGTRLDCLESHSGIADIWVNAAYPRTNDWAKQSQKTLTQESWAQNVSLQMNSYCLLSSAIAERMAGRGGGSIINLGSIYGLVGPDFNIYEATDMTLPPTYAAIKAAIVNHSRYLASYYGSQNVRVNTVCPGGVLNEQPKRFIDNYSRRTPMGRLATAEEIGGPVAFLASPAASYITGSVLTVDGGWTAI